MPPVRGYGPFLGNPAASDPPEGSPWDDEMVDVPLCFLDLEMTGLTQRRTA